MIPQEPHPLTTANIEVDEIMRLSGICECAYFSFATPSVNQPGKTQPYKAAQENLRSAVTRIVLHRESFKQAYKDLESDLNDVNRQRLIAIGDWQQLEVDRDEAYAALLDYWHLESCDCGDSDMGAKLYDKHKETIRKAMASRKVVDEYHA